MISQMSRGILTSQVKAVNANTKTSDMAGLEAIEDGRIGRCCCKVEDVGGEDLTGKVHKRKPLLVQQSFGSTVYLGGALGIPASMKLKKT